MIAEVGGNNCLQIRKTIEAVEAATEFLLDKNPATIVIMSPHGPTFRDAVGINIAPFLTGNLAAFGAPDIEVSFETSSLLVQNIIKQSERLGVSLIALDDDIALRYRFSLQLDHGAVIPLHYFHKAGFRGQIVHMASGFLSYSEMYTCGKAVQTAICDSRQKVAVIASGDLSHRLLAGAPAGFSPEGKKFDAWIVERLKTMDVKSMFNISPESVEDAGECGLRPIFFLMGALDGLAAESQLLSYEGPFGVGYAVATFSTEGRQMKEGKT
jgi:aromatic ring-opening dioxygenase LigB subunit